MSAPLPQLSIKTFGNPFELYTDSRSHGYAGSSRNVRLARVTPQGGGSISKSEDGTRCAVTGRECMSLLIGPTISVDKFFVLSFEDIAHLRIRRDE